MRKATNGKTIIVGDFNLDYPQKENVDYRYANFENKQHKGWLKQAHKQARNFKW